MSKPSIIIKIPPIKWALRAYLVEIPVISAVFIAITNTMISSNINIAKYRSKYKTYCVLLKSLRVSICVNNTGKPAEQISSTRFTEIANMTIPTAASANTGCE